MDSLNNEYIAKKLNLNYCKQHNHVYEEKCVLCENGIEIYDKWGIPSTINLKDEYELFFNKTILYGKKLFKKSISNNSNFDFTYKKHIPKTSLYYWRALKIDKNIMVAPLEDVKGIVILINKIPVITFVITMDCIHLEIISNKIFEFDGYKTSIDKYLECEDFPEIKGLLNYIVYFCNNKCREHNKEEKNTVMNLIKKVV